MPVQYESGSEGRPTIVFLPGSPGGYQIWEPILERAPEDVRVLAVTYPGHGSLPDDPGVDLAAIEQDAAEVIRTVGAPVTVTGICIGAYIAARLLSRPELPIARAMLVSGFAGLPADQVATRLQLGDALEAGKATVADLEGPMAQTSQGNPG